MKQKHKSANQRKYSNKNKKTHNSDKNNIKKTDMYNILLYMSSFIFLFISSVFFCFAFYYESKIVYYIYTVFSFALFLILYYIFNKKITCKDGYNFVQAYLFFKKYQKIYGSEPNDKALMELTKTNHSFNDFNEKKALELYNTGYYVSTLFENKKNKTKG